MGWRWFSIRTTLLQAQKFHHLLIIYYLGNNSNKLVTVLSLQIILPNMINIEYLCFKSVDFDG
jgi:hypothetical protein